MSLFTPVSGIIGGALIGLSASTLMIFNGDIMGISGIMASTILQPRQTIKEQPWKTVFLASFLTTVALYTNFIQPSTIQTETSPDDTPIPSTLAFVLGGFLVGFGTKLGNGCTTGHGICGLARLSRRSMAAVATFVGMAVVTTALKSPTNPLLGSYTGFLRSDALPTFSRSFGQLLTVGSLAVALPALPGKKSIGAALSGFILASGLAVSRMISSDKIHDFLDVCGLCRGTYDPTLLTVMGSGVLMSWLGYQLIPGYSVLLQDEKCLTCPVSGDCYRVPTLTQVDWKLLTGAATFGVGWGIAGFCPGPALYYVAAGMNDAMFAWLPAFVGGSYMAQTLIQLS